MLRMIGLILLSSSAVWAGFQADLRLRSGWRELERAAEGLARARRRMALAQPGTPELMAELGKEELGELGEVFAACALELDRPGHPPLPELWRRELERCQRLWRPLGDVLEPLGDVLGRTDSREQCRVLAQAEEETRRRLALAQAEGRRLGRVYRTLGLSGGAFLVILLL